MLLTSGFIALKICLLNIEALLPWVNIILPGLPWVPITIESNGLLHPYFIRSDFIFDNLSIKCDLLDKTHLNN